MTPATPTAAAPIRQRLPSYSSSSARSDNPRPSARLRLPARPRAASMSAEARPAPSPVPPPAHPTYDLSAVIALALSEDAGDRGDVSCLATIPTDVKAEATFIAKEDGVIVGISLAEMIFNQVDPSLKAEWFEADGNYVRKGLQFGKVYGCAQSIIVAERVVLNFMQRMSGIATMTKAMADAARPACILETRKTAPGLRLVDKWAVLIGGGKNHRLGLFDMVMIKDNHISVAGGITNAMTSVDQFLEKENLAVPVEVETRTLEEVRDLLKYTDENKTSLTRIMLDNMVVPLPNGDLDVSMLKVAVQLINGRFETESPPPLCMYYRWIDTHMPAWAVTEIRERSRRAWASLHAEERREKAAAEEKAEQEKELKEYYAEQRSFFDEMLKKNREEARRLEEAQRQRQEAREAERQRKKERARAAKEAEEAADGKGKYPRWTR